MSYSFTPTIHISTIADQTNFPQKLIKDDHMISFVSISAALSVEKSVLKIAPGLKERKAKKEKNKRTRTEKQEKKEEEERKKKFQFSKFSVTDATLKVDF